MTDRSVGFAQPFNPQPLTEGTHQRCDDSYFEVYWQGTGTNYAGWYWMNFQYFDGQQEFVEADGTEATNHGPYLTQTAAAYAGWADDPEAEQEFEV